MSLLDRQAYEAAQQRRLQEQEMRLRNNPGRIFLQSLSQTVPQAVVEGAVQGGLNAFNYKVLGGERKQMFDEALQFRAARDPFFEKYYKDQYDKIKSAQGSRAMPGQAAAPGRQQLPAKAAPKPKKQKRITLPDGRVAVEAKEGELAGTFYKGKRYNIVAPETPRQEKISAAPETRSLGDGRIAVKVDVDFSEDDSSPEELQEKLAKQGLAVVGGVAYKVLNQEQSARYVAEQRKRQVKPPSMPPAPDIPVPQFTSAFDTSEEYSKGRQLEFDALELRAEAERKSREKAFTEQQKTSRKKLDKLQDMLKTQVTKAFEYVGISGVEDLRKAKDNLLSSMASADSVEEIDIYLNAINTLPTENQVISAGQMLESKGGSKVGQTDTRKRGTTIRMPSTRSFQTSAEVAQIAVNKLRIELQALTPGTDAYNKGAAALRKAESIRDSVILASYGNASSTGPVITNTSGDVLVSRDVAERYGGTGTAPDASNLVNILKSGGRKSAPIVAALSQLKKEGKLTDGVSAAFDAYMTEKGSDKSVDNLVPYLQENGAVKSTFLQDPEKTFEQLYPNLAKFKNRFKDSTLMDNAPILEEMNSQLKEITISDQQMSDLISQVVQQDASKVGQDTVKDVVKNSLIAENIE